MRTDLELLSALSPIMASLSQLSEPVEDTHMEVGSEAYASALLVYQYARAGGKGSALDGALDALSQRFARKSRPAPKARLSPPLTESCRAIRFFMPYHVL